ncbi:hypothetical protein QQ045_010973 [Rhodiola kirilowii]
MDIDEIDETTMSTIEVFEIPTHDEFDRDYLENLDIDGEEGYKGKGKCHWELRASKKKKEGMWRITTYGGDHTCEVDIIRPDNVHFNKHFVGMDIKDLIREDLRYSPKQVRELMRSKHGYKISYIKA